MFPKIITLFLLIHSHLVCNAQHLRDPSTVTHKDEIIQTERPIIYTFFELKKGLHHEYSSKPHENLLKAWTTLWTEAGWEPRILTLEDAKQHPDYEKYKEAISSVKNLYEGGYDFMCFMRWLAMAARGTGGWMSDNDVFPMGITPTEGLILPNKGRFTGHERHVPSLLSGSAEEWKRMAKDLLDFAAEESKHVDWFSDMNALKMIHEKNPDEYIKTQDILNGFPYEAMGKVDCNLIGQFKAVHLAHMATHRAIDEGHIEYSGKPEDIGHSIEGMRPGLARKLYQEWNEQCAMNSDQQRPVIYTFFEQKKGRLGNKHEEEPFRQLISAWTEQWAAAGWEPRILTLEDAKQHPDYEKYSKAVTKVSNLFSGGYDFMCFMRWLAMAAQGTGGWMSDNDVFPMGITPTEGLILPNEGQFTSYERFVPSLMSGSAEEWNRMANDLMEFTIYETKKMDWFSDLVAMKMMSEEYPTEFLREQSTLNGFPYEDTNVVDCSLIRQFKAIHLAPMATQRAIEDGKIEFSGNPDDIGHYVERMRPQLIGQLYQQYLDQCVDEAKA